MDSTTTRRRSGTTRLPPQKRGAVPWPGSRNTSLRAPKRRAGSERTRPTRSCVAVGRVFLNPPFTRSCVAVGRVPLDPPFTSSFQPHAVLVTLGAYMRSALLLLTLVLFSSGLGVPLGAQGA